MSKEIDRVIPIKRRISWIVPDNTEDIIKMASIESLSSLSFSGKMKFWKRKIRYSEGF